MQQIKSLPTVDTSVFDLNDHYLDEPYNEGTFDRPKEKSVLHKLSYKYPHSEESGGKKTF